MKICSFSLQLKFSKPYIHTNKGHLCWRMTLFIFFFFVFLCLENLVILWKKKIPANEDISHLCYKKNTLQFEWPLTTVHFSIMPNVGSWGFCGSSPYDLKFWAEGALLIWDTMFSQQNEKASIWAKRPKGHQVSATQVFCPPAHLSLAKQATWPRPTSGVHNKLRPSHRNERLCIILLEDVIIMEYNNTITRIYNYSIVGEFPVRVNWTDQNGNVNKIYVYIFYA